MERDAASAFYASNQIGGGSLRALGKFQRNLTIGIKGARPCPPRPRRRIASKFVDSPCSGASGGGARQWRGWMEAAEATMLLPPELRHEREREEGERASADESAGVDFRVGGGEDCDVVRFAHQPICSLSPSPSVCVHV